MVTLRISKAEHVAWDAAAARDDISLAEWIRRRVGGSKLAVTPPRAKAAQ